MSDRSDFAAGEVPRHIAIIMDGNNRWARARKRSSSYGHKAGVEVIREVLRSCSDLGVEVLTLFAFSSENWQRPKAEVSALMTLFGSYLKNEVKKLHRDGIRLRFIGSRERLNSSLLKQMDAAAKLTENNRNATLVIAVDYGGQWDITQAVRGLARQVESGELRSDEITEELIDQNICLADLPRPDLCIRTADEHRISNFLLWQLAYSELYFSDVLWPDFGDQELRRAVQDYAARERRFGGRLDTPEAPLKEGSGHA